jgi:hypothetical protein
VTTADIRTASPTAAAPAHSFQVFAEARELSLEIDEFQLWAAKRLDVRHSNKASPGMSDVPGNARDTMVLDLVHSLGLRLRPAS